MGYRRILVVGFCMAVAGAAGVFRPNRASCQAMTPSALPATTQAAAGWQVLADPSDAAHVWILKNRRSVASLSPTGWGAKWAWAGFPPATGKGADGHIRFTVPFVLNQKAGQVFQYTGDCSQGADGTVVCKFDLSCKIDVPLTMIVESEEITHKTDTGKLIVTFSDGKQKTLPLANPRFDPAWKGITKLQFQDDQAGSFTESFDHPVDVFMEAGNPRVQFAGSMFHAPDSAFTIIFSADGPMKLLATPEERNSYIATIVEPDWWAFNPANDSGASVIGMQDWLDAPAGKHGGVRMNGDHFQFEDGTPVKFWGTNLAYGITCTPPKPMADSTADRFAKYGVNAVRMHKFCGAESGDGINLASDATKLDPKRVDRFDYFTSRLASKGIYYGFSHTYGFFPGPDNASALLDYAEIKAKGGNTYGLINVAPDIQDLLIQRVVNLLNHTNPYTHHRYADDPALAYIEMQNEDDIFFFTTAGALVDHPHYAKAFNQHFSQWLKAKYGDQDGLRKAWRAALHPGETLDAGNIAVQGNPWFMGEDHLPALKGGELQRMLDNAAFEHQVQNDFYGKMEKAIRDTGYKGPLCGSPWQAPGMLPELLNLKSDYNVGYIDRHNYGGGGINSSIMASPGGSFLGSGLQQVADRPFGISEWIINYPDLYTAEGPALMAVYGMGLQGWDCSYEFQSHSTVVGFSPLVGTMNWGFWDADTPTQIGQFPILGRMIMRGDVKQGDIISDRKVSTGSLATGKFDFTDKVVLNGDVKKFGGSCPPRALAAGRCVIEFTGHDEPSSLPDMAKFMDGNAIVSNTGQLRWDPTDRGNVTVNTEGTKAVIGFAQDKPAVLGNVTITMHSPYGSVFLTAADKAKTLADSPTAILSAVGRSCNTDFSYFTLDNKVINNGKSPILMQPVKADFTIAGRAISAVNVLDQDGRITNQTIPVNAGSFRIDTGAQKTMYYQIVFAK